MQDEGQSQVAQSVCEDQSRGVQLTPTLPAQADWMREGKLDKCSFRMVSQNCWGILALQRHGRRHGKVGRLSDADSLHAS